MMKPQKYLALICGLALLFVVSCSSDPEPDSVPEFSPRLLTFTKVLTRQAGDIRGQLGGSGLDLPIDAIRYAATMYKVEYTTMYKGQEITASGTAFLPESDVDTVDFPLLSFQHGTIASNAEAPSELSIGNVQNLLYSGMAGAGVIVVVPDFIGFGSSAEIVHPYYVDLPTAESIVDMIRAGGEMAVESELSLSDRLYLAGYSQGGYATMSAHKYIEEQGLEWFELQKSYPSSGGYDVEGVRDYFFSQEVYDQPFFLAYVAEAYRTYYDWSEEDLALIFKEPYASLIPDLFDGSKSGGEINELLTSTISDFVTEEYLTNTSSSTFDFVNEAFQENTLIDWVPTISVALFHGDADVTVPYQNSVDSYDQFLENGTDSEIISFTTLPGATHGGGFVPYLEIMLNDLVAQESIQ